MSNIKDYIDSIAQGQNFEFLGIVEDKNNSIYKLRNINEVLMSSYITLKIIHEYYEEYNVYQIYTNNKAPVLIYIDKGDSIMVYSCTYPLLTLCINEWVKNLLDEGFPNKCGGRYEE